MTNSPKSPQRPRSFDYYLKEGIRLNLLTSQRFMNLIDLVKRGWQRPYHEDQLVSMIESRERTMLLAGTPCPPPSPDQVIQGRIIIGMTVDPNGGYPVAISERPVPTLAIGKQGTGKTRAACLILLQILRNANVVIFDGRHDLEFVFRYAPAGLRLDAAKAPINLYEPDPGIAFETNLGEMVNTQGQYLTLYHRGMNVLQIAANSLKKRGEAVTALRILQFLWDNKKRFSQNYEAYNSAIDRLESLVESFPGSNVERGLTTPNLLQNRLVYFDTSSIPRTDLRISFIASILKRVWLWQEKNSQRLNRTEVLVVIDEAEFLFSSNLSRGQYAGHFIQDLLRQGRAVGLNLLLIVHEVKNLDHSVLANAGNLLAFRVSEADDQRRVANALGLPYQSAQTLGALENRHCQVRIDSGYLQPFLMRTLDFEVNDQPLTLAEKDFIQQRQSKFLQYPTADTLPNLLGWNASTNRKDHSQPAPKKQSSPDYNTINLLTAIKKFGKEGLMKVYKAAQVAPGTGAKRLRKYTENGWVRTHKRRLPGKSGLQTTPFLTKAGRELIGAEARGGVGGDDHTAYQEEHQFGLSELGYDAEIERTVEGKAVDVVVRWENPEGQIEFIAIEIDLSTDPLENARKDLERGFAEIFLNVARDQFAKTLNRIKERFSEDEQARIHVVEPKNFLKEFARVIERKQ